MASSPGDTSVGTPSPRRHVISAPRPSERPKLGLDLPVIDSTESREQQTARDPELNLD